MIKRLRGIGIALFCLSGMVFGQSAITVSVPWNPPSVTNKNPTGITVSVPGAHLGDQVSATHDKLTKDVLISGFVRAEGSVRVVLFNVSGSTFDIASGTLTIVVSSTGVSPPPPNQPPTASPTAVPSSGAVPLTAQFQANAADSDGTIVSYSWSFGDGGTAVGPEVSHTFQTVGSHTVIVTVTDDDGASGNGSVAVTVTTTPPPPPPPPSGPSYYVAPGGSDSNPGTESLPFKTIQKCADIVNPGETCIVEDGTYTAASGSPIVTLNRGGVAGNLVSFRARNKWGAKLDGRNNTNTTGVKFRANYIRWEGFEIFGVGNSGGSGTGLDLYGYGFHSEIVGNNLHDIGRVCTSTSNGQTGILISNGTTDVLVEGNLIHDIGRFAPGEQGCTSAGGFENHDHGLYMSYTGNVRVWNNVFYNHARGWAIHAYNSSGRTLSGVDISNNTFATPNPYRTGHIIFSSRPVRDSFVRNNIFYQPNTSGIQVRNSTLTNVTVQNNLVFGGSLVDGSTSGMTISGTLLTNPLVVDAAAFNFRLTAGSPALAAGVPVPVLKDFDGKPRSAIPSIGAFE